MKKTKEPRQTVSDCEETLRALEDKRVQLIARGAELPELRRSAAYLAHVERNAEARRALDKVNAEVATHASELASLDDAIAAAKSRVLIAQAFEVAAADRARAREAVEILAAFKQAGVELDHALRTVGERAAVLNCLLGKLHATGVKTPTHEQLDALGFAAMQTAIQRTPWAKRFRPVAPSERREFGPLFAGWAAAAENRLRSLLTEPDEEAA